MALQSAEGSTYPSDGINAAPYNPFSSISGNSSLASCGVIINISKSKLLAIVANLLASNNLSLVDASLNDPVFFQSNCRPSSFCNLSYISTDFFSIRVVLREERSCPTKPAACQVAPSVRLAFSRRTISVSPFLAR